MALRRCLHPETVDVTLRGKRSYKFSYIRVVKGGIILRHLHRPIAITGVLIGGRREGQEQKSWDRAGWPAGLERVASRLRQRRARALLRSPEREPALPTPDLRPITPALDFRPLGRSDSPPAVLSH